MSVVNSETLRRLAALKLPDGALSEVLGIIADMQSGDEERKKKDRERKRKIHGNSEENPRNDDGNSDGKTVENPPYKDNHASAGVCSNGSSLRSDPIIENKQEKLKPTVLSKKSECLEILLECLSVETATDVLAYRKVAKGALTPGAMRGLAKQFRDTGNPQAAALEYMAGGYRGYFPKGQQPRDGPEKPKNPWLKRMVEGELEHRAKINGNSHELGLHDLEILRGDQEPTMLDGLAFDARDDAAPRGK